MGVDDKMQKTKINNLFFKDFLQTLFTFKCWKSFLLIFIGV